MKTKRVLIQKTRHKSQPFTVTMDGRVDVKTVKRYTTPWRAAIGAVRLNKEWLKADPITNTLVLKYPDGRERFAFMDFDNGTVLGNFRNPAKKK